MCCIDSIVAIVFCLSKVLSLYRNFKKTKKKTNTNIENRKENKRQEKPKQPKQPKDHKSVINYPFAKLFESIFIINIRK